MVTDKQMALIEELLNFAPKGLRDDIRNDLVVCILTGEAKDRRSLRRARDRFDYSYKKHRKHEIQASIEATCAPNQIFGLTPIYQKTAGFNKLGLCVVLAVVEAVMVGDHYPCASAARITGISRVRISRILGKLINNKPNPKLSEVRDILEFKRLLKKRIGRK